MQTIAQVIIDGVGFMLTLAVTIMLWFILLAFCIMCVHIVQDYYYKRGNAEKDC